MGWLTDLTMWLVPYLQDYWAALKAYLDDWPVMWAEKFFDVAAIIIESIPMPDFLSQYSLTNLFGNAGPTISWIIGKFRLSEGMTMVAAAYGFRMLRKLLTLFQW